MLPHDCWELQNVAIRPQYWRGRDIAFCKLASCDGADVDNTGTALAKDLTTDVGEIHRSVHLKQLPE